MKLKSTLITSLIAACMFNEATFATNTDPFIKEWKFFDGINTYTLNITTSSAPGQSYRIDYTFPGGNASTDMCKIISSTLFSCLTGEIITRDDINYAVKLTADNQVYTFYDPNHMPPITDAILGQWQLSLSDQNYKINIMSGANDSEYKVLTSYDDQRGNKCSYTEPDTYQVTTHSDGSKVLSFRQYSFKYDGQAHKIVNPNPGKIFYVGQCVVLDNSVSIPFTKN